MAKRLVTSILCGVKLKIVNFKLDLKVNDMNLGQRLKKIFLGVATTIVG